MFKLSRQLNSAISSSINKTVAPLADPKGPLPIDYPLPKPEYSELTNTVSTLCFEKPQDMVDWYPGPMIGAQAIGQSVTSSNRYVDLATELLSILTPDDYSDYMKQYYLDGKHRFGEAWGYADIVTTVLGLADIIKPKNYLEIGVRRGRSACAVASRVPDCELALFDMWVDNYAGMGNPGPDFVCEELKRTGHRGKVEFINGNSHQTIPSYFQSNPGATFDMITVDGDHTNVGAAQDLADVLPRVSIGGAVIFDDVCHPKLLGLGDVWRRQVVEDGRFSAWTYSDVGYGVGFAIRKF